MTQTDLEYYEKTFEIVTKAKPTKEIIKNLLLSIDRAGKKELVAFLEQRTDYFTAPASTKYHLNFEGGLAQHSLNVFNLFNQKNHMLNMGLTDTSIIICGILHDCAKIGLYTKNPDGTYNHNPETAKRGHAKLSIERIKKFLTLTDEEEAIIKYHMATWHCTDDPTNYCQEYSLLELHNAIKQHRTIQVFAACDIEATISEEKEQPLKLKKRKISKTEIINSLTRMGTTHENLQSIFEGSEELETMLKYLMKNGDIIEIRPGTYALIQ